MQSSFRFGAIGRRRQQALRQGGEQLVKSMALKAMELSRQRAMAVSDALRGRHKDIDPSRIEAIGRGWEEPASTNSDLNRRVEVQWFTRE